MSNKVPRVAALNRQIIFQIFRPKLHRISDSYWMWTFKPINQLARWPCIIGEYKQCWLQSGCSGSRPRERGAVARARCTPSTKSLQPATLPQKSVTYILYIKMQSVFFIATILLGKNRLIC